MKCRDLLEVKSNPLVVDRQRHTGNGKSSNTKTHKSHLSNKEKNLKINIL